MDDAEAVRTNATHAIASTHSDHGAFEAVRSPTTMSHEATVAPLHEVQESTYLPLKAGPTDRGDDEQRPPLQLSRSNGTTSLHKAQARRRSNGSGDASSDVDADKERVEIERLLSRMFGEDRQKNSEKEKKKHVGVVFRDLTVKGHGLGAALQQTNGDFFLGFPRFLIKLFTQGPKAAIAKPSVREILSNFNGCIKPGEMLLVLGRPGSGCSTFLKVLGNQRGGYSEVKGTVTYGGTDAKQMAKDFQGEVLYNPENDLHYATLTVKQTLEFALRTKTPSKQLRNDGESRKDYVREFLQVVLKLFWIENTINTKVGGDSVRGVSGGEKKRVSIAEAMIAKASVQMWDNSTRGLDASTALEYVEAIRSLTNMAHVSVGVALYQAGESLYDLFDKVVLIEEGKCLYYGPTENAKQYFLDLGFECPGRWTTADFLTSVSDEHERSIRDGWASRIPRSAQQFETAFRNSDAYRQNLENIAEFEGFLEAQQLEQHHEEAPKKSERTNYTLPFHQQVWACTKRQGLVLWGDKASFVGKWGGITAQALIVGSLFYDLSDDTSGVFSRGGVLFFILLFNALLALAEMSSAFGAKAILLKHKSFSFYRPAAYAVAQTVIDAPLCLVQVLIFTLIISFMSNLAKTPSQYFIAVFVLWLVTMIMYGFFRAVSSNCKSLDSATKITGAAIQVMIVYVGYIIPPRKMHPWFKWLSWLNPLQYGFECLMANEFSNREIQCVPPNLVPQGPGASSQYQACALPGSLPGQTVVSGAAYIRASFSYSRSHLWRNVGILCVFFLVFFALTVYGMERAKPNAGGASVTIFKRGQIPTKLEGNIEAAGRKAEDEESGSKKSRSAKSADDSGRSGEPQEEDGSAKGIVKNETIFTFTNVDYVIPYKGGDKKLLSNVEGFVRPGKLTALMGASGAGKTTLLNTLAQRITFGTVTGEFLVDGRPLPKSFQRATGFAEQLDIHEPTATVREALRFSALLRQPKEVPTKEKYEYCERVIDLLEMRDIAGAAIGTVGQGLDQEQRKRVTIGVELASKPELLMFLDEPTSGLDSGAAFNIVRFLRKLADAGQAILCTIHQPSSVLFEYFDEVLLLKAGGRVVYSGELGHDSRTMVDYFEKNGAHKCPDHMNPAEYMLEAIGAGNPDYKGKDWAVVWEESNEHHARSVEIADMIDIRKDAELSKALKDDRTYAMPLLTQTIAVIKRSFVASWRNPEYATGKIMLHVITGLTNSFTFYHAGFEIIDFQSRLFSIFMTLAIAPPLIQQLQPVFLNARNIFSLRENNSKIYSWFAFTTAAVLVDIPYSLVAGSIYFVCW
ncbi:hypothetical protein LTR28_000452, partial [Elasticomyces elasticus]